MVLVRTETGQLVMVPQQVLAQAQAKTQQGGGAIIHRPATPTAGTTVRVTTASTVRSIPLIPLESYYGLSAAHRDTLRPQRVLIEM